MSYKKTFQRLKKGKEKALVPFVVIGDPDYNTSLQIVRKIAEAGADILELGYAFSDPIADGSTIQAADTRALANGINTDKCFNFIRKVRGFTDVPIGLLVYSNLVLQRGINRFYADARNVGVDSVLLADVPAEESGEFIQAARKNKIETVFIVSPLTNNIRLRRIVAKTKGFVYIVSRLGVTGARGQLDKGTLSLVRRVRRQTKYPLCVGFGISNPEQVRSVLAAGADGAIVGSAIVSIIQHNLRDKKKMISQIGRFVQKLKQATL
ncbi:MAG TPA: tryptophan synthase subunit alpha [Candidatus Nanoarchaeia archaeon]|nr:tryptophan synthase subunit alpha [Candidatus Nanoarchaeia archaeon]